MASAVANRYARALVDVVLAPGSPLKPDDAVGQLRAMDASLGILELRTALAYARHPDFAQARRHGEAAGRAAESPLIRNFIYVMIDHRRIGIIEEIREAFELHLDERLGFVRAEVTSAATLEAPRRAPNSNRNFLG